MKNTTIKITTLTHNKIVKDEVIVMDKKITCRPCKEKNNWEIENEFGVVLEKHYKQKMLVLKQAKNWQMSVIVNYVYVTQQVVVMNKGKIPLFIFIFQITCNKV